MPKLQFVEVETAKDRAMSWLDNALIGQLNFGVQAIWRWEFMRRNDEFRKDHKKATTAFWKALKPGKLNAREDLGLAEFMMHG